MSDDTYPDSWEQFIGNSRAVKQLRTACASAKLRRKPLDHVLIAAGDAGIGKTTLAMLTASEMGTKFQMVTGKVRAADARRVLADMQDGDVLFIDEIHKIVDGGKAGAEWLLHYLQDGVLVGPQGPEEQPRVTVIGATTDAGRLPQTIVDRFLIQPMITPYTQYEAGLITMQLSGWILPLPLRLPTDDECEQIARAASHNPRVCKQILTALRDLGITSEDKNYHVEDALDWLQLTEDGLTLTARRYLLALAEDFDGQVGTTTIQERLNEPGGLRRTEQLLMTKSLIAKTKAGRVLTNEGKRRVRELQTPAAA